MADERMWTYPELKFVTIHQYRMDAAELTAHVNRQFHGGSEVRSVADVNRIMKAKTIFNRQKKGRGT